MKSYIYVFITIILTVYGQIIIKFRASIHSNSYDGTKFIIAMFLDLWVISGLLAALAASATWMMAVRNTEISLIYPIMALTFILVPALAVACFGESLNNTQIIGLFLIVIGIGLSAFTS